MVFDLTAGYHESGGGEERRSQVCPRYTESLLGTNYVYLLLTPAAQQGTPAGRKIIFRFLIPSGAP